MIQINMNLVYTIINLIVLYLLLRHFLIRPVMEVMEKRRRMIDEGFQNARSAKEDALKMKREYEASLSGAKQEAVRIEREKAMREMKSEIASLAAASARKLIKEGTREQQDQALYDEFLKENADEDR